MYLFEKQGEYYRVTDKDYQNVRDQFVSMRPYITVENGDYMCNGELYLVHSYEGTELDLKYLENMLPYIYSCGIGRFIWRRLWMIKR